MTTMTTVLDREPGIADPGRVDGAGAARPDPEVPERARRRTVTAKYKLEVLAAYDAAPEGEKGAVLRREGLYSSHIVDWRRARDAGALAERTGVPLRQLRQMTIAGQAPWLLDTLDPEPVPGAAFDTYVHQDSVLLTAKERPRRQVPGWRAWLPTDPKRGPARRPSNAFAMTLGIPDDHLPRTLAEQRARQKAAGPETTVTFSATETLRRT